MKRESAVLWMTVALAVVLAGYLAWHHKTSTTLAKAPAAMSAPVPSQAAVAIAKTPATHAPGTPVVYAMLPNQVLATVNGMPITLGDLIPLRSTNEAMQQMDSATYQYLLQRAINRMLIVDAAEAKGIALTESQERQLDDYQAKRAQPEPGLIAKLNVDPAQIQFEMQDQQAFMLQTSLMQAAGYSPNVTPDEVQQYYQQHIDQYGQLPQDPQAQQQAWQSIEYQIREKLADSVRTAYQQQLDTYMNQLKANASIVVTPLAASESGSPAGS
jgi:hypothetical protein